ncbi:myrosinase 1 isoform X2 [Xylocopa sonorina]|uniref:myrosinase 1 isoform X2 n=1 Tax=Xylocopa sonorina TaxID=1818115 RepID=UPI00403ABEA8
MTVNYIHMVAKLSLGSCVVLLLAICASGLRSEDDELLRFPPNFLLGVATAAYQIEGAWNVSDKGESIWDHFVHKKNNGIYNNDTGDVAADSYHKYKEDIAIVKKLGFKVYRFSLSWPRILPHGFTNKISRDGLQHYHNFIDELLANDIEPMVTIYHWDHPQILEEMGGWTNPDMVDWYGDYATVVFREFGSKVKRFIPINEPMIYCTYAYMESAFAPGKIRLQGIGEYLCVHNMLKAHARAYRIYESQFKAKHGGEIGLVPNIFGFMPKNPGDEEAVQRAYAFRADWVLHPIYSKDGDYPSVMKEIVARKSAEQGYARSRLPTFDAYWIDYIRGSYDFLALNHYTSKLVTYGDHEVVPSYMNDQGLLYYLDSSWKSGASEWLKVVPQGIRMCLRYIAENYDNPPIYITENGFSDHGTLNDDDRIYYYREYLKQMLLAIYNDGVDVRGYMTWSLLDDFEWNRGYSEHFGIVSVDFNDPDRPRALKKSASWWHSVNTAKRLL